VTQFAHQEPRFAGPASGNPEHNRELKAQYWMASHTQRRKERVAFSRSMMEWIDNQIRMRGISRRELAGRCCLSLGTVTQHFKHPERVHTAYLSTYLHGLGVRLNFQAVALQSLEEIPNIEI
jgi:hypothetical protein